MDPITLGVVGGLIVVVGLYQAMLRTRLAPARQRVDALLDAEVRPAAEADVERFRALLEPECEGTVPIDLVLEWINCRRLFDRWQLADNRTVAPANGRLARRAEKLALRSRALGAQEELGEQLLLLADGAGYEVMLATIGMERAQARELIHKARRP